MSNQKKDILFVINNLDVGGAEKALVSLLSVIDYNRFNVDLQLFRTRGLFLKQVPKEVNVLPEIANYKYFDMPFTQVIKENFLRGNWNVIYRRIQFKFASQKGKNPSEYEQFQWEPLSKTIDRPPKKYDVAIGFLEKNPNYFVVDKVDAKKKIGWIQNDYIQLKMNADFDCYYFRKLDVIVANSEKSKDILMKRFPKFKEKFYHINNIISKDIIRKLSKESIDFELPLKLFFVSGGRLVYQKGFDIALQAIKILKEKHLNFVWFIYGEGKEKGTLEKYIIENDLSDFVQLLGVSENPYWLISKSDIYIHPSRFEGKSVMVDEVKLLSKPILITNFPTAKDQIKDGETGLICDISPEALAIAIEKLIKDKELREKLSKNLSNEDFGMEKEIEKFYQIIEN